MRHLVFALLPMMMLLHACQQPQSSPAAPPEAEAWPADHVDSALMVDEEAFHFFVIGDWGRNGDFNQKALADKMGQVAGVIEPEFIISTGDNFYDNGVASTQDPLWEKSFEDIYTDSRLNCDWWVVLGNHDYRGNIQAQIDYSQVSRRWNMPAQYFSFEKTADNGSTMLFVFTDTNPLNDEYYHEEQYAKAVSRQDTSAQLAWLEKTLAASQADWKIVVGHHPMYTGGKRIEEEAHVRHHLEERLKRYGVDFYFCGHEHDLQYIKPEGSVHHIVSGAGSEVRPTGKLPQSLYAESIQGFVAVSVQADSARLQFVDYLGRLRFSQQVGKMGK